MYIQPKDRTTQTLPSRIPPSRRDRHRNQPITKNVESAEITDTGLIEVLEHGAMSWGRVARRKKKKIPDHVLPQLSLEGSVVSGGKTPLGRGSVMKKDSEM